MKTVKIILLAIVIIASYCIRAQVAVNTDGSSPNASAMLDVKSTDKGFLPPRMSTAQMNAISSPPAGLMIFNTTVNSAFSYNGSSWKMMYSNDGESCGTIDYGGQIYQTVIIGTQCWMAENMNIGTMINSMNGGTNNDGEQTDNGTIEKYCYNNSTTNCDTYGGLYQWDEMMQYVTTEGTQGICPTGWHLPTDVEWCTLENYVDAGTVSCSATGYRGTDAGGNLKESGITHWNSPNTGATNSSGFTGLPGGYRIANSLFSSLTITAYFWSSSVNCQLAWFRYLNCSNAQVGRNSSHQGYGYSVRCVRD